MRHEQEVAHQAGAESATSPGPSQVAVAASSRYPRRAWLLWLGILLALALGAWLRLALRPWRWWVNPDEGGVFYQAATSAHEGTMTAIMRGNAHPPLYFWFLRLAAPLLPDPISLRWLSLLAGLLTIVVAGWLGGLAGARSGGERGRIVGGWFGAFSVACAAGLIVQSTTLRPYALCVLCIACGLGALLRYTDTGRWHWLPLLSLSLTAAVMLLYASFLVVGAVGLAVLTSFALRKLTKRQMVGLAAASGPVLVAMSWLYFSHLRPHLLGSPVQKWATDAWLPEQYPRNPLDALPLLYAAAEHAHTDLLAFLVLLPALLSVVLAIAHRELPGLLVLALSLLAVLCSAAGLYPLGGSRHSLYLVPVFVMGGGSGLAWLLSRPMARGTPGETPIRRQGRRLVGVGLVLVVLIPMGALAMRLLREGQAAVLGPSRRELILRRSTVSAVTEFITSHPTTASLMDTQTAWLLMPLADPIHRVVVPDPVTGAHQFEVLGRRFVVLPEWSFYLAFQAPGQPSLRHFLAGVQTASAGASPASVMVVSGSFRVNDVFRLLEELGTAGHPGFPSAGDSRLAAAVCDVETLESWRQSQDAGHVPGPPPSP